MQCIGVLLVAQKWPDMLQTLQHMMQTYNPNYFICFPDHCYDLGVTVKVEEGKDKESIQSSATPYWSLEDKTQEKITNKKAKSSAFSQQVIIGQDSKIKTNVKLK